MSKPTSYRVIELVKARISNDFLKASDTDAAKALGISRGAVTGYKASRDVMSPETLDRAQALIQLPPEELADFQLSLAQESAPNAKSVWAAVRVMLDRAKNAAAAILAVLALLFGAGNYGTWIHSAGAARYTLCARRRLRRLGLFTVQDTRALLRLRYRQVLRPVDRQPLKGARLLRFYNRWRRETHQTKQRRAVHA